MLEVISFVKFYLLELEIFIRVYGSMISVIELCELIVKDVRECGMLIINVVDVNDKNKILIIVDM